jgi:hypothetical protein
MRYDLQLGFLAADAIREFSRANQTKEIQQYTDFLQRSDEYCKAVRRIYGHPIEADIPAVDAMEGALTGFMRTLIKTQQPSPAATAKLEAVGTLEELISTIRRERRQPSDEECLKIAKTIYATSAADPR